MRYSSAHTSNIIEQLALVVFGVKEINDGKRDQSCKKESHFVSLRAESNKRTCESGELVFVWTSAFLTGQAIRRSN
jgi:hypothetical protein